MLLDKDGASMRERTMAIRDKLMARCQKLLPADTQIRHVFRCASPTLATGDIIGAFTCLTMDCFVVAVTADEIFVLRASRWWPSHPIEVETRLPRNHLFNLDIFDFMTAEITLTDDIYRVPPTDWNDVEAADAELKPPPIVDEKAIAASRAAVFRRRWSDAS
jgi:hypothetical protein